MQVAEIMEKFNINADVTVEQNESSEELLLLPETVEAVAAYQEIPRFVTICRMARRQSV